MPSAESLWNVKVYGLQSKFKITAQEGIHFWAFKIKIYLRVQRANTEDNTRDSVLALQKP